MSRENVEIIRETFERFAAGDRVSWRQVLSEDVIWDISATAYPSAGVFRGHEETERFFVQWLGTWEDPEVELLELIEAGDSVITIFRWTGRGKASGVEAERTFFGVYDLRDGKVVRYRQYDSRDEVLAAAGLDPEDAD